MMCPVGFEAENLQILDLKIVKNGNQDEQKDNMRSISVHSGDSNVFLELVYTFVL